MPPLQLFVGCACVRLGRRGCLPPCRPLPNAAMLLTPLARAAPQLRPSCAPPTTQRPLTSLLTPASVCLARPPPQFFDGELWYAVSAAQAPSGSSDAGLSQPGAWVGAYDAVFGSSAAAGAPGGKRAGAAPVVRPGAGRRLLA
jgi:hypothetical protein